MERMSVSVKALFHLSIPSKVTGLICAAET